MNKNDGAAMVFAQLLRSHLGHITIRHLPLDEQIAAVAYLSVFAVEKLDEAIEARNEDAAHLYKVVRDDWQIVK